MAEKSPQPSNEYQLPPDISAMIAAGNEARARGVDPDIIAEERADDKSYIAHFNSSANNEAPIDADADSQAMQDAIAKAKAMGERAAAQEPLFPKSIPRSQADQAFYKAHWDKEAHKGN